MKGHTPRGGGSMGNTVKKHRSRNPRGRMSSKPMATKSRESYKHTFKPGM